MNSMSLAIRALAFAAAINLTPAAARTTIPEIATGSSVPQAAHLAPAQPATGTPHWEWQYHYAGRHARYEGHWVLVR